MYNYPMEAHPRKIQRQDRAVIDVRYNMAPFSTGDRIRPATIDAHGKSPR